MIKIRNMFLLMLILLTFSCKDKGVSTTELTGVETNLPPELKGLKVYKISIGDLEYIRVGVLNGEVNSVGYPAGKVEGTTLLLHNRVNGNMSVRPIFVKAITFENDSVIVILKDRNQMGKKNQDGKEKNY
jgi:hypothetical protein